jgi:hypothetical protein
MDQDQVWCQQIRAFLDRQSAGTATTQQIARGLGLAEHRVREFLLAMRDVERLGCHEVEAWSLTLKRDSPERETPYG